VTQAKHILDSKDLVLPVQTPQTNAYSFLNLGNTNQTGQTVCTNWTSRHSRLSHVPSPKRAHLSRLSWITSPERAWNNGCTPTSRLGKPYSPERDFVRQTPKTPRLDEDSRSTYTGLIATSLRRAILAW